MANKLAVTTDRHEGVCDHHQICCPHQVSGLIKGSANVFMNGASVVRDNDPVTHNCPHCGTGKVVAKTPTVKVNGRLVAVVGDTVTYPGGKGIIKR